MGAPRGGNPDDSRGPARLAVGPPEPTFLSSIVEQMDDALHQRLALAAADRRRLLDWAVSGDIIELGCGPGAMLQLIRERFAGQRLVAVDKDRAFLDTAARHDPRTEYIHEDLTSWSCPEDLRGRFSTVVMNAVMHEIDWPYGRDAARRLLTLASELLSREGVLLFRDGVKPAEGSTIVELQLRSRRAREKIARFLNEYRQRRIWHQYLDPQGSRISLSLYDLHDVLNKYYFEGSLRQRDVDETFGQMTMPEYRALFSERFHVVHCQTHVAPYLRAIWAPDVLVVGRDYPDSHIVIVAEAAHSQPRKASIVCG